MLLQSDKRKYCDGCGIYGDRENCGYCEYYIVTQEAMHDAEVSNETRRQL